MRELEEDVFHSMVRAAAESSTSVELKGFMVRDEVPLILLNDQPNEAANN